MAWEWLKDLQGRGKPKATSTSSWAVTPLSQRYKSSPVISMTGAGPDGVVQPGNPVGMSGNTMLHEGESRIQTPAGQYVMDAAGTNAMAGIPGVTPAPPMSPTVPAMAPQQMQPQSGAGGRNAAPVYAQTPAQQKYLAEAERQMQIPGAAGSGWNYAITHPQTVEEISQTIPAVVKAPGSTEMGVGTPSANITPSANVSPDNTAAVVAGRQTISDLAGNVNLSADQKVLLNQARKVTNNWSPPPATNLTSHPPLPTEPSPTPPLADDTNLPSPPPLPTEPVAATPVAATPVTAAALGPTAMERLRNAGVTRIADLARNGSSAQYASGRRYLDDLAAQQATERMVGLQQGAQNHLGEPQVAARQMMLAGEQGAAAGKATAELGTEAMKLQEQAAGELSTQAGAAASQDWTKDSTILATAIKANDFTGADAIMKQMGLAPIDWTDTKNRLAAGDLNAVADRLYTLIEALPDDADPQLRATLVSAWTGNIAAAGERLTGANPIWGPSTPIATGGQYAGATYVRSDQAGGYVFKGTDGKEFALTEDQVTGDPSVQAGVPAAVWAMMHPTEEAATGADLWLGKAAAHIDDTVMDYYRTPGGEGGQNLLMTLTHDNAYFKGLLADGNSDDPTKAAEAWTQMGSILGASWSLSLAAGDLEVAYNKGTITSPETVLALFKAGVIDSTKYTAWVGAHGSPSTVGNTGKNSWLATAAQNNNSFVSTTPEMRAQFVQEYAAGDPAALGQVKPSTAATTDTGINIFTNGFTTFSDAGHPHYRFSDGVVTTLNANKGHIFNYNGHLLMLSAYDGAGGGGDNGDTAWIEFTDMATGKKYYQSRKGWTTTKLTNVNEPAKFDDFASWFPAAVPTYGLDSLIPSTAPAPTGAVTAS